MRVFLTITFIFMLLASGGCGLIDGSDSDKKKPDTVYEPILFERSVVWSDLGLDGIPVHDLEIYDNNLYAATDEGAFKAMINSSEIQWELLGLESDTTWVSAIEHLSNGDLLAVIRYSNSLDLQDFEPSEIPRLFRSQDGGSSWEPDLAMQLEGIEKAQIRLLKKQSENSETLFAYRNEILRSDDNGKSWQRFPDFEYSGFFLEENALSLKVNPYNPNQVWYGGSNQQQLTPIVIDSNDGGETWNMRSGPAGSSGVQNVVFSPDETDIMASTGNKIGITDGNTSPINGVEDFEWTVVYDREKHGEILDLDVFTLKNSRQFDSMIYASGGLLVSGNLAVILTEDFGKQWQYSIYDNGPQNIDMRDMTVAEVNGNETLFLATDNGVFGFSID